MPVEQLTLSETQQAIANLWGTDWASMASRMSEYGLTSAEMADTNFLREWSGGAVEPIYAKNGETILGYNFRASQSTVGTGLNSNTAIIHRGYVGHAPATTIETIGTNAGKVKVSRLSGIGSKVVTGASKLAIPLTLASIGITLGKTIDETLYNVNPDYWDSIGLFTLNPQTWSSIAGGDDTLGGSFINAIFGIDPQTGETQAYIDSDAMAYMSYVMAQAGIFSAGGENVTVIDNPNNRNFPVPVPCVVNPNGTITGLLSGGGYTQQWTTYIRNNTSDVIGYVYYDSSQDAGNAIYISKNPFQYTSRPVGDPQRYWNNASYVLAGRYYYANLGMLRDCNVPLYMYFDASTGTDVWQYQHEFYNGILNGTITESSSVDGIGDQEGATIPNFDGLSESEILPYLQQTYPDMFNNAINYPVVQPDGTVTNHTYVPITLPFTSNMADTQPISGNQTQANPIVDPSTSPQELIDLLTNVLQQPMTEPISDTTTPPENPTDTGEGSSPVPIVPVGSASALWKIYHPTQAQIDSFGGWLWSSNFIDQILKIFNNPMEAVIGLHKVYATPIDAGIATIKVGYLDSQVPSAYIEQQYIEVNCGSVNLFEQFGNVFDYSPFTDVQLYLPFVGIVPLNVADVMRSSVSVIYGVDVITGACLAQVKVSRDDKSSILYQYSGNCAVQYPISSGSYMGIVSSIISVAGGVAATVASGGAAAPLALGAAGGLLNAHTNVQHSGGFSGNAGAMGGKIPYLIITRPQTKVAYKADALQGYSSNSYTTIGECSGYVKADSVHVVNVNATDEEINEINNLILSGIII